MPRAFYKFMRERAPENTDPIMVSSTKSIYSTRQAHDYLLCDACEDRFNKCGEKWIVENCWQSETDFPLREKLVTAGESRLSSPDFHVFQGAAVAGVDVDTLAYFAASVFWRAAVHQWHLPGGDPISISLGPYVEEFRTYLLGKAQFPVNAVLIAIVATSTQELHNKFVTFPWFFNRTNTQRQFKFIVPGLTFQLFTGKVLVPGLRAMCSARSPEGFVYMVPSMDQTNMEGHLKMIAKAKTVGRLARR